MSNKPDPYFIDEVKKHFSVKKYHKASSLNLNEWVQQISCRLNLLFLVRVHYWPVRDENSYKETDITDIIYEKIGCILDHGIVPFDSEYTPSPFMVKKSSLGGSSISRYADGMDDIVQLFDYIGLGEGVTHEIKKAILESKAIEINLNHSDKKIVDDFTLWLAEQRKANGYPAGQFQRFLKAPLAGTRVAKVKAQIFKKNPTRSNMQNWAHNLILPYFDLKMIFDFEGIDLTNAMASEFIYTLDDTRTEEHVKQTTKPWCDQIFTNEYFDFLSSLNLQNNKR
jgi:hypothetical protein